jgi:hypothetical protein
MEHIEYFLSMLTSTVLMICPESFESNVQTITSNIYQKTNPELESQKVEIKQKAKQEFKEAIKWLRDFGIEVIEFDGNTSSNKTPGFFILFYCFIFFILLFFK